MKKIIRTSLFIITAGIFMQFTGCSKSEKKNTQNNQNSSEEVSMLSQKFLASAEKQAQEPEKADAYLEKNIIENEKTNPISFDVYKNRMNLRYGTIKHETYYSNTCRMERGFSILLPASYDGVKKYPVVYFQHGIFGDEYGLINDDNNKINQITTNLAADGHAKEMIIVFGHMYATDNPEQKPAFDAASVLPYDNFINELVNDLMPYIESHYAVLTGRENTALLGFSMGGRESLYIGLLRPDLFGYVGAIAPAPGLVPGKDGFMVHEGSLQENEVHYPEGMTLPSVMMICCGTRDSVVGKFPESYHKLFEKNEIEHTWFEVSGADHDNNAIRTGLYYFIQRIF